MIIAGAVLAAGGLFWLSHLAVHASYLPDVLPGMLALYAGFGPVFVGTAASANAGVPPDKAGWPRHYSTPPSRSAEHWGWPS